MDKVKVLLVDDEERYLKTMSRLMSKKGCEVLTAQSGPEALESLTGHPAQVVILDVKMPGMDGNQTLREIKNHFPLVEVIMLTGHATVDSAIDGLKAGAFDYLMKPADIDAIMEKVEDAYEKRQRHEEKIRVARSKRFMQSPREIIKAAENDFIND